MNPLAALAVLLACLQEPDAGASVTGSTGAGSALRIQVSGALDLHGVHRGDRVDEAGNTMNTGVVAPGSGSTQFWAGTLSLRLDIDAGDGVTGVLELENRSFDEGMNLPFGHASEVADPVNLQQAYINVDDFLAGGLRLRLGVQDFALRNRPHDEPFFLDLGATESFNAGLSVPGRLVRNTTDRDVREAAGVRLSCDLNDFLTVQALAVTTDELGAAGADESVYTLLLNGGGERVAGWIMANLVAGAGVGEEVFTAGLGVDSYYGPDRQLELFAEVYGQKGTLMDEGPTVRKHAYAANAGFRYVGILDDRLSFESAISIRTGNRHVGDRRDEAFQSYENVNRFIVLQSAEFGLDVDTNIRIARWGVGYGPVEIGGRPLTLNLDVGSARADAALRAPGGGRLSRSRRWGTEIDLRGRMAYNAALSFWFQGGYLPRSSLIRDMNPEGSSSAGVLAIGADLTF